MATRYFRTLSLMSVPFSSTSSVVGQFSYRISPVPRIWPPRQRPLTSSTPLNSLAYLARSLSMPPRRQKVAADATSVEQVDIDRLRSLGLSDKDIVDVVLAASVRCFFSKVLDGVAG